MNKTPVIVVLAWSAITACNGKKSPDYFTGTVQYAYTYSSDVLNADSLAKTRPSASEFRYDSLNYQSRFYGQDTTTYFYSGLRNRCIAQTGTPPVYSCEDYGIATDSVLTWRLYETGEKVLGMECSVLELQKRNSQVRYYISKVHRIAPATYRQHRAYNWDVYGQAAGGGLILKLEHRFPAFTMQGVATSVIKVKSGFTALGIDKKMFSDYCK